MSTLQVGTIKSTSSSAPVFQNSSGVEKGMIALAWANVNGEGTASIRASFNFFRGSQAGSVAFYSLVHFLGLN